MATAEDARLLFIIDNDYGEMTLARLFLHGQGLERRTTFMVPPRLYVGNQDSPIRTLVYTSYKDIRREINELRPDIVFFCSGYLFSTHQLLSVPMLEDLITNLQARGCSIVTSDPFWGLMSTPDPVIFAGAKQLTDALPVLRNIVHLYPAPFSDTGIRSLSFFNPRFVDEEFPKLPGSFWKDAGGDATTADARYWVFALTQLDYNIQVEIHSKEGFAGRVVTMLANTFQCGRYPILLAPDSCIWDVEKQLGRADTAVLLPYCPYDQFTRLLINAEYAFYWNAGSASAHLRMVRGLPVFSFDQGHIARCVRAWYQRMIKYYYNGWVPAYLDHDQELRADTLEGLAANYRQAAEKIRANLSRSHTPEETITEVLKKPF
jgi:hypothetical protein